MQDATFNLRRVLWGLGAGCAVAVAVLAFAVFRPSPQNGHAQDRKDGPPSPYFRGWNKPDLALVLSGQMMGYDQPCGCSSPQYGGLARRYELIKSLKAKGWPTSAIDLGDIAMEKPNPHTLLKYETAMKALKMLDYSAIGLGKNEIKLPLIEAISHFALEHSKPRLLAANLKIAKDDEVLGQIKPWEIVEQGGTRVGVIGLVGPTIMDMVKGIKDAQFENDSTAVLETALAEVAAQKADVVVLLYQGFHNESVRGQNNGGRIEEVMRCIEFCARRHQLNPRLPKLNAVVCLTTIDNPPPRPDKVGDTLVITLGHKATNVGVLGVYKNPFDLKYDLIPMGPDYETPAGKDDTNPVLGLLENYSKEVKRRDLIAKFPRSLHTLQAPVQYKNSKYVGSERCGECHQHAYKVWEGTGHSHAFNSLEKATRPPLRQFDGECVVCHTVGFQHPTGYLDAGNSERLNKKLLHVGCESCHGPGSMHADQPTQHPMLKLAMNPWKASSEELDAKTPTAERDKLRDARMQQLDQFCIRCHDSENDVHWTRVPFMQKWKKIEHTTPPEEAAALGIKR